MQRRFRLSEMLQAVVADTLPLVRLGVAAVLGPLGIEVLAETHSGREAAEQAAFALPDLVVVGTVADGTTIDALQRVRATEPPPRTIALLARAGDGDAAVALGLGVTGLALRGGPLEELATVVVSVLKDETAVVPALQRGLVGVVDAAHTGQLGHAEGSAAGDGTGNVLSAREREMLGFLAQGRSNREIAATLSLSLATVKSHLVHLYAKLGVRNRNEALTRAVTLGLLH